MPRMDGLEATGRIARDASIPSRIVILTTFERDDYVFEALRGGASGFLLKNSPPEELVHAVRVVASGDALLAPSVTRKVIETFIRQPAHHNNEVELRRLTERETEILRLLATGKSNSELAGHLFVGEGHDQNPRFEPAHQVGAARQDASGHLRLRERPDRTGTTPRVIGLGRWPPEAWWRHSSISIGNKSATCLDMRSERSKCSIQSCIPQVGLVPILIQVRTRVLSLGGRAVRRTFAYCGGPSGQVRALPTRRRTALNGGVRGIVAGSEFPAKSSL